MSRLCVCGQRHGPRTAIVCRGIPGSGKSTFAERHPYVCSADNFYLRLGRFDASKLSEAHAECRAHFELYTSGWSHQRDPADLVIVDNTNVTNKEMEFYVELALSRGYNVEIREFNGTFKSIHDVPESTLERMRKRWEPVKPEWEKYLVKG